MPPVPQSISGATLACYAFIDATRPASTRAHYIATEGKRLPVPVLAIGRFGENEKDIALFGCDQQWNAITHTFHISVAMALLDAEDEYRGTLNNWRLLPDGPYDQSSFAQFIAEARYMRVRFHSDV